MLELPEDFFDGLGLDVSELLSDAGAVESKSLKVRDISGRFTERELVIKVFEPRDGEPQGAIWDTGRWNTRAVDQWVTSPVADLARTAVPGSAVADRIQFNWMLAEQSSLRFFPRILEIGEHHGLAYLIRPFFAQSLQRLARTKIRIKSEMLLNLIGGIWDALSFLHQTEVNLPHGNLKLANVIVGMGPLQSAGIFLTDAVETSEMERRVRKRADFQQLGSILYQLVSGDIEVPDPIEALVRADGANWDFLGRDGTAWKRLAIGLLDDSNSTDPATLRNQLHEGLSGKMAPPPAVLRPKPPPPQGPPLADRGQPAKQESWVGRVDLLIESEEFPAALKIAVEGLGKIPEEEKDLLARIGYVSESLRNRGEIDTSILPLVEEGAKRGVPHAALLLGLALREIEPGEAVTWLEKAIEAGLEEAVEPLARLLESGWEGTEGRPTDALRLVVAARQRHPDPQLDYLCATMIMRGRTGRNVSEALPILEACASRGDFRAADLLGQCYATGFGVEVEERKAYSYFVEAWSASKSADAHYYTASNNLGVCFAIGFGVPKNLDNAKHYFRQGATRGHEPSKENLDLLTRG